MENKDEIIDMVAQFVYLGGLLTSHGDTVETVEYRLGIARACFNTLGNIWCSHELDTKLKIDLYKVAIVSTATYGCVVWKFDSKAAKRMNNFNSKCLAMITGRSIHDMAKHNTHYNMVHEIRVQRIKRIQTILKMEPSREPRLVLEEIYDEPRYDGSILADMPLDMPFATIEEQCDNNKFWRKLIEGTREASMYDAHKYMHGMNDRPSLAH